MTTPNRKLHKLTPLLAVAIGVLLSFLFIDTVSAHETRDIDGLHGYQLVSSASKPNRLTRATPTLSMFSSRRRALTATTPRMMPPRTNTKRNRWSPTSMWRSSTTPPTKAPSSP